MLGFEKQAFPHVYAFDPKASSAEGLILGIGPEHTGQDIFPA
jgi:hypothetical protein